MVHNPITGLVIHSISEDTTVPPPIPLYTAVRLSATATNPKWWETNAPHPTPQWVTDINAKITRLLPHGKAIHEGDRTAETAADGDDGIIPRDDEADDEEDDDAADGDRDPTDAHFDPWATEGPDVHPTNMRLWGLALSPGGGSTAILATPLLTQQPMRGTWAAHRSRVVFSHEDLQRPREQGQEQHNNSHEEEHEQQQQQQEQAGGKVVAGLSTEARLWEWMHGGGPGVPGLTPPPPPPALALDNNKNKEHWGQPPIDPRLVSPTAQVSLDLVAAARRARIREIFVPFVAAQRCEICSPGSVLKPLKEEGGEEDGSGDGGARVLDAECAQGHRVAVCGVSGMAILAPGISRACGVCRCRCLVVEWLLERVLVPGGREEEARWVEEEMEREVCGRCGGKFLD